MAIAEMMMYYSVNSRVNPPVLQDNALVSLHGRTNTQ